MSERHYDSTLKALQRTSTAREVRTLERRALVAGGITLGLLLFYASSSISGLHALGGSPGGNTWGIPFAWRVQTYTLSAQSEFVHLAPISNLAVNWTSYLLDVAFWLALSVTAVTVLARLVSLRPRNSEYAPHDTMKYAKAEFPHSSSPNAV